MIDLRETTRSPRETKTRRPKNSPRVCITCSIERPAIFFPKIAANQARSERCQLCRDKGARRTLKDSLVMAAKKARAKERLAKLRRRLNP